MGGKKKQRVVLGLTGSFGSGKSTVSKMLQAKGIKVIDDDVLARKVVEPGTPGLAKLVEIIGEDILTSSQTLDRKKLGELIFSDDDARKAVELILHPEIAKQRTELLMAYQQEPLVVIESPLLLENKIFTMCTSVTVVICESETLYNRAMARDGLTKEEIGKRLAAQMPQAEKAKRANYVIRNNGSIEETAMQVEEMLQQLGFEKYPQ